MPQQSEILAALVLNQFEGLGPIRLHALLNHFRSAQKTINAGLEAWSHILQEPGLDRLVSWDPRCWTIAEEELVQAQSRGLRFWLLTEGPYPARLRETRLPPLLLYVKGPMSPEQMDVSVALVGSRRCSYYGERMAKLLSRGLAEAGWATVSGLARGVDGRVHEETLAAGGLTAAVVGCGLAHCYPSEHRSLLERISERGAVISEFPLEMMPLPGNFPRRNRIIAGLTRGTVVVEGNLRSGSLITACLAANEGREVFAVPGLATSFLSEAPHMLIRQGAVLVRSAADILQEFGCDGKAPVIEADKAREGAGSDEEKAVLSLLESEDLHRESLAEALNFSPDKFADLLIRMELSGQIRSLPGGLLARRR